jgi:hypothetical protein
MKRLLLLCLAMLLGIECHGAATSAGEFFSQGSDAYNAGNYEKSAGYFGLAAAAAPSAGSWHDLGNAEWQLDHTGPAILAWERAEWIDPFSPNPRANLRFARKARLLDNPELAWYEICSTWLPVNAWPWMACAGFWLAVSLVVVPGVFRLRLAGWHQALAAAGLAVFLLTLPAMYGVQTRSKMGIVLPRNTPLRLTPTHEGQAVARLSAGETVRLERRRGDFLYVRTAAGAGWITREEFGLIAASR